MCPYVAQPLCQRNMVRAGNTHVGGAKTTKPRIRIRRVARRHRLLEFDAEVSTQGKMRWSHSELHWSDPPILTLTRRQPHNKHTRRRQVVISKRIWAEMNTNDAKEYLARREIPQLFEVRRRMRALRWCSFSDLFFLKKYLSNKASFAWWNGCPCHDKQASHWVHLVTAVRGANARRWGNS